LSLAFARILMPSAVAGVRGELRGWFHAAQVSSEPFGGSLGERLLVGDWWEHLAAAVPSPVVVAIDEAGHLSAGLVLGGEVAAGETSSCSSVELKLSAAALSNAEPTRPIDWRGTWRDPPLWATAGGYVRRAAARRQTP
jgi:hypothetical protein